MVIEKIQVQHKSALFDLSEKVLSYPSHDTLVHVCSSHNFHVISL